MARPLRDDTSRPVVQSYAYDDLHRLITAGGTYAIGADHLDRHQSAFTYDTIGNFLAKDQRHWYEDPLTGSQANRPHRRKILRENCGHDAMDKATHTWLDDAPKA